MESKVKQAPRKRRYSKKRKGFCKKKCPDNDEIVEERGEGQGVSGDEDVDMVVDVEEVVVEQEEEPEAEHNQSASARKLQDNLNKETFNYGTEATIFFNTELICNIFKETSRCPECLAEVKVTYSPEDKKGLAHFFSLKCSVCYWEKNYCSSREIKGKGRSTYEINLATVFAFREIGIGYKGLKSFCGAINIPPPMNPNAFEKTSKTLHAAYANAAEESMKQAALETKQNISGEDCDVADLVDIRASFDGSWQKRGFASLNGVVTAMSPEGKCIDFEVLSKVCKACEKWKDKEGTDEYIAWKETHVCSINHEGSAGSMESVGVKTMYHRSIEKHGLRYTTYLGDGDTKSFQDVVKSNPYPGVSLGKDECLVHVQKRVGTRLRDIKSKYKGVRLGDDKLISGPGRLTDKAINTLQNYYGMAIRQNNELYAMKKAVAAVLHHCSEATSMDERHKYCPKGEKSWCKYQVDQITGGNSYKEKVTIPESVCNVIRPVFSHSDLGSDELLSRCLHGATQNVNESLNNVIWQKCSKRVYVGLKTLQMATASAVINFNDGGVGLLPIFDKLKIRRGQYRMNYLHKRDAERVRKMNLKSSKGGKRRRSHLRAKRKGYAVSSEKKDGKAYKSGGF